MPIIKDGTTVTIKIVEKDADGKDDANSQQELKEKGYTLPEYAFVVECAGVTSGESGVLEVYAKFISRLTLGGKVLRNKPCKILFADGSEKRIITNDDGYIILDEVPIGNIYIL